MAAIELTNPSVYFECPVCMEDIDDSWKMLPCQHVFCLNCLRRLYDADQNQNPRCPTCRKEIAVSLERLQKPRLLYEMYDNWRTSGCNQGATDEFDRDLIAAAEIQSIDDLRRIREDMARENEQLQIALCKSADEAAQKVEMDVAEADLIAAIELSAIELSVRENAKRSSVVDGPDRRTPSPLTNVPVNFGLSPFNESLKVNGNADLKTILNVISNEEDLNSMESTEIVSCLKIIDGYLNALKNFRRQQIDKIIREFGEADERLAHILTSENGESGDDGEKNSASCNKEEDDLISLMRALELEENDDALLKVTLKKSEVLDPIDRLQRQLVRINTLLHVIIESENHLQTAAPSQITPPPRRDLESAVDDWFCSLLLSHTSSSRPRVTPRTRRSANP